ncbi:TetR/AcrR family transcriptional regulator [Parahaliea aestuarii]|uniref:TetR family transcriptional regulator n=1 Tax=Parahaliea aestuarii TaxID=1852021 RepID=A0A5C8ZML7_9GAMM|nr:TetR family transcriptional regulator [Parahaliea aestuarii]TXS89723.1 TetR family transcriptional regulator [Parahaliea aestuarii]
MSETSIKSEQGGRQRRAEGRQRRAEGRLRHQQILEATLRLIAREGIRAVRHRAVAKEAGVPLAATTYYFSDIGQLLSEAFTWFAEQRAGAVLALQQQLLDCLQRAEADNGDRGQLVQEIATVLADHVIGQSAAVEDRSIELAFKHEARRDAGLRALNEAQERQFAAEVGALLERAGSDDPFSDTQIGLGLIYRLEAELTFGELSESEARRILLRHVDLQLGTGAAHSQK